MQGFPLQGTFRNLVAKRTPKILCPPPAPIALCQSRPTTTPPKPLANLPMKRLKVRPKLLQGKTQLMRLTGPVVFTTADASPLSLSPCPSPMAYPCRRLGVCGQHPRRLCRCHLVERGATVLGGRLGLIDRRTSRRCVVGTRRRKRHGLSLFWSKKRQRFLPRRDSVHSKILYSK